MSVILSLGSDEVGGLNSVQHTLLRHRLGAGDAADPEVNKALFLFLAKELLAVLTKILSNCIQLVVFSKVQNFKNYSSKMEVEMLKLVEFSQESFSNANEVTTEEKR